MASSISHKGRTTVFWGADNVAQNGTSVKLYTALCESASFKPITERVKAAGSDGATKTTSLLVDGETVNLTFLFETGNANVVFPAIGEIVSIKKPGAGAATTYEIVDLSIDARNKDHARISLTGESHGDVTLTAT